MRSERTKMAAMVIFCLLCLAGCGGGGGETDGGDRDGADGTDTDANTGDDGGSGADQESGGPKTSTFALTVEEVNIGDETVTYQGTTNSPSADFGASIRNGRLTLRVKNDEMSANAAVDTSDSNTVPGTFSTNSGFTDGAWVELYVGSDFWDMQNSGQLTIDSCPSEGDMVTATLSSVRLATSLGYSIKVINGTMRVEVVSDDGSLKCN